MLAELPGIGDLCRVVWRTHVREMTDLAHSEQHDLLDIVLGVETVLRTLLRPAKMNVASLGNIVPHLHWHVIPRFLDDPYFPDSIWSTPQRPFIDRTRLVSDTLRTALHEQLKHLPKIPL